MPEALVVGGRGFIGSALSARLREGGAAVTIVGRGDPLPSRTGDLYFCAGLTADFRTRLHDTIAAHVTLVSEALRSVTFDSFTYFSSTRVYQRAQTGEEGALLPVDPADPSDVYNLSKLTGESLCLAEARPQVRVVRLSNVFGPGDPSNNFLNDVVAEARRTGAVVIRSGSESAKDYIAVEDVAEAVARVPARARSRILNVAAGRRTSHATVGALIESAIGARVTFSGTDAGTIFPEICNRRMREELGVTPTPFETAFRRFLQGRAP